MVSTTSDAPLVVYDACVLFPAPLRDLLMRVAVAGLVQARWSDLILDEVFRNLAKVRPDLQPDALTRTRGQMNAALPRALVTGFEPLVGSLALPDPDDRHVLAAAIQAGASVVLTFNLKDFPASATQPHGVEALHPDVFLDRLAEAEAGRFLAVVEQQARALKNPPTTGVQLLDTLERQGLRRVVARLRPLVG